MIGNLEMGNQQLFKFARDLNRAFSDLRNAHRELQNSYLDTIQRLVLAAEFKDENTGNHIKRIGHFSVLIAEKLGLSKKTIDTLRYAAPMHDIGKIGIPDAILQKPGKLSPDEFDIMKTHTLIGAKILDGSDSEILQMATQIAISHHEKWNGKGYPYGLAEEDIPLAGRIVGLADFFDALTSRRPYRGPVPRDKVVDMIRKERGQHFDPHLVDLFLENRKQFEVHLAKNGEME